jgi:hypothetical protein
MDYILSELMVISRNYLIKLTSRNYCFLILYLFLNRPIIGFSQVEIFRNQPDTSTFINPSDTITSIPVFENGDEDFFRFLETNIDYRGIQIQNLSGENIKFSFYVEKNGEISDVKIINSSNMNLSNEMIRVMSRIKPWTPGYLVGKKKKTLMIYDLNVRSVSSMPPIEITKNNYSIEYTNKTKSIKWFIVVSSVLILTTLFITR